MKKMWYLSVLVIPVIVLLLFTGCPSKDGGGGGGSGSFTYDGNTYSLTGAGMDDWGSGIFELNFVSSGINVSEWTGTGYIVWFDLTSPSTACAPGTYDWAATGGFELWEAAISLDYVADTDTGTWLGADWAEPDPGDYISISVSGSTYTFEFSLTMFDDNTVTGSYTGPLTVW